MYATHVLASALSFDDAPAMEPLDLDTEADATMDSVRETLQRHAVKHCVAFVIGARARGHKGALERWLAAGYELGNHTETHPSASRCGVDELLNSFARCDALLVEIGAFDQGRTRYFRYPYGDRGADPRERARIHHAIRERGYLIADVSISLHDFSYEAPLANALQRNDADTLALIEERYRHHARTSLVQGGALDVPKGFVHVANGHFGRVTARTLDALLTSVRSQVTFFSMANAATHATYLRFAETYTNNGIIAASLRPRRDSSWNAAARRGARLSRKLDLFDQKRLGPLWPQWSE